MISWVHKTFDGLALIELHDVLRLRTDVFVVEQTCPYPEVDGRDPEAWHLLGLNDGRIICYARILPPAGSEPPHIGRVVVHQEWRGRGLAKQLMERAILLANEVHGTSTCMVAAQSYLQSFYESLGFVRIGDEYVWDGIPHIDMRRG